MACIFILSGMITRVIGEMVSGYEAGLYGIILRHQGEENMIALVMISVPILLIAVGVLSLFIYGRNDDHWYSFGLEVSGFRTKLWEQTFCIRDWGKLRDLPESPSSFFLHRFGQAHPR